MSTILSNNDEDKGSSHVSTILEKTSSDAYGNLTRGLTSDELSQSGTQKLILNDLSKSEAKVKELEPFRDKYYLVFTEKSILEEKLAKTKKAEILYSFCITAGGLIIGLSKLFLEKNDTLAIIMITIGALLIVGGILFKINFRK